eukprot:TRINITY_DN58_c0_g2_i3.p1 TRINITY_DN58_c0_g2~~TRINITY_DN58_c0_g2_i3.p1  ORF type:complete len:414 (+),score=83.90 TRINITY_DN58_c0_g2_i3:70-1242(+)
MGAPTPRSAASSVLRVAADATGIGALTVPPPPDFGACEIQPDEVTYIREVGGGSYGKVFYGKCRELEVAVKLLYNVEHAETFFRELKIMSKVVHPNVCLYLGACTTGPDTHFICMEWCPRGDLNHLLFSKEELPLFLRMRMATDAARGMCWLHESNPAVLHRDLKTSNMLVTADFRIKICDFGLAALRPRGTKIAKEVVGTVSYISPEVLLGQDFTRKADVYSFGICLWEIFTRLDVFPEYHTFLEVRGAVVDRRERPPVPPRMPSSLAGLMTQCWHQEPKPRPDFREIVSQLQDICVDAAVLDPDGRNLWKRHDPSRKERVAWDALWSDVVLHFPPRGGTTPMGVADCVRLLLSAPDGKVLEAETLPLFLNFGAINHIHGSVRVLITIQ